MTMKKYFMTLLSAIAMLPAMAGNNVAPIIIDTKQAGTLTIFLGGGVATNKSVNMMEGENGISAKVLSSGAVIENGGKPETAIDAWDGLVFSLEANKTYKFFVGGTKWRLAAIRYIPGTTDINEVKYQKSDANGFFDLQGRKVTNLSRGIYIHNGKKLVISNKVLN